MNCKAYSPNLLCLSQIFFHQSVSGAAEAVWQCMDTRGRSCSWAGRTREVGRAEKRLCSPNIGYVQWFEIEIFTMSTKWTFICNFENLSKVALWVSFEPYRYVSMCLLFAWSSSTSIFMITKSWWNKNASSSLWNQVTCTFSLQQTYESPPSALTFPDLEKDAYSLLDRRKESLRSSLRERNHKVSSTWKNIKA